MSQGRRHLTDEFKREAVALLVSNGRPLSRIASELGISPSMLRNWRNGSGGRNVGSARDNLGLVDWTDEDCRRPVALHGRSS